MFFPTHLLALILNQILAAPQALQQTMRQLSPTANDSNALKIGSMATNSINDIIGERITDPKTKALLQQGMAPECINRISEPNMQQIKQIEIAKCLEAKKEKADNLYRAVQTLTQNKGKCVTKLDINALQCDIHKALDSLLKNEYYKVTVLGNMYVISVNGAPLGLSLFEHMNYDVVFEKEDKAGVLENPDAELTFNEAGILIGQTGAIKNKDPQVTDKCAECYENIDKVVVDGQNKCSSGCESDFSFQKNLSSNFATRYKYVGSEGKTQVGEIKVK